MLILKLSTTVKRDDTAELHRDVDSIREGLKGEIELRGRPVWANCCVRFSSMWKQLLFFILAIFEERVSKGMFSFSFFLAIKDLRSFFSELILTLIGV